MKLSQSLFRHLLAWTLGSLFVVWAVFVYFGYRTGVHEADELTDGHLASVASVLSSHQSLGVRRVPLLAQTKDLTELKAHDYQQSLSIIIWDANGKVLSRSGEAPIAPFTESEGFETVVLSDPPGRWRLFSRWNGPDHLRKVAVMLSLRERDALAARYCRSGGSARYVALAGGGANAYFRASSGPAAIARPEPAGEFARSAPRYPAESAAP